MSFRQRLINSFGQDPLMCRWCNKEMELWRIWHPDYGDIFDLCRDGPPVEPEYEEDEEKEDSEAEDYSAKDSKYDENTETDSDAEVSEDNESSESDDADGAEDASDGDSGAAE